MYEKHFYGSFLNIFLRTTKMKAPRQITSDHLLKSSISRHPSYRLLSLLLLLLLLYFIIITTIIVMT